MKITFNPYGVKFIDHKHQWNHITIEDLKSITKFLIEKKLITYEDVGINTTDLVKSITKVRTN